MMDFSHYRAFDVPDDDTVFERVASDLMPAGQSRVWNNAIMELGGVACTQTPRCDEAGCPWRGWCSAYQTGDFTAPDVPTQPSFEGSRRQFRGRVIRVLRNHDELTLDELGPRIRVDYIQRRSRGVHRGRLRTTRSRGSHPIHLVDHALSRVVEKGLKATIEVKGKENPDGYTGDPE